MDYKEFEKIIQIAIVSSEYNQLFLQLKRLYSESEYKDKKEAHRLQDIIYRKFIQDIMEERIKTIEYLQTLASQINEKVVQYDMNHEY